jgi:site-specific DNA-adenine methylase
MYNIIYMKNHFYISYFGNKRDEVENIYNKIDLEGIETFIEPYCGTCAISYYISTKEPNKYKYILNDNNIYLYEMFKIIKDPELLIKFEDEIKDIIIDMNKEKYNNIVKRNDVIGWFIKTKYYNIRPGLYPLDNKWVYKSIKDYPIFNFFNNENIEFKSLDGIDIYNKYKDDSKSLIFLDPPYMKTCNEFYENHNMNIYEYLYENNIDHEKAKIYLVLENIWMCKLLFNRNRIIDSYDKLYQTTKKKTNHIIIYNKKG